MARPGSCSDAPLAAQRPDRGEPPRAVPAWSDAGCRGGCMEDLTEHEGLLIQQVYENMSTSRPHRVFSFRREECADDRFYVPETVLDDSCLLGGHGRLTTASRMAPAPAAETFAVRIGPAGTSRRAPSAGSPCRLSAITGNRKEVVDAIDPETDLVLDRSACRRNEPETFSYRDALNGELGREPAAPASSEQENVLRLADLIAKATADLAVGCTRSATELPDFLPATSQGKNRGILSTAAVGNPKPKSPGKRKGSLDRSTANEEFSELAQEKSRTSLLREVDARKAKIEATLAQFERMLNTAMHNDENLRPLPPKCQKHSTQSDDAIWGPGSLLWQQYTRSLASLSRNVAAAHEVMDEIHLEMSRLAVDAPISKADTVELPLSPKGIKYPSIGTVDETHSSTLCGNFGILRDKRDRQQPSQSSAFHLRSFGSSSKFSKADSPTADLLEVNVVLAVREAVRAAVREECQHQPLPNVSGPACALKQKHFRDASTATEFPQYRRIEPSLEPTPNGEQHVQNDRDTPTAPLPAVAQRWHKDASDAVSHFRKARNELKLVSGNRKKSDHGRTGVRKLGGSARLAVSRKNGIACTTANGARQTQKSQNVR